MNFFEYEDENVIEDNEKWFKFYVKFPTIISVLTAVIFFLWGIIDPATIQFETVKYVGAEIVKDKLYGLMAMNTFFGAMIVWWIIGAIVCAINFFLYKIILAPIILNIFYLKNINSNTEFMLKQKAQPKPTLSNKVSYQAWVCPKCGEKNNYAAKNCANCYEPKP